jgi:hypothetical protein
MMRGFLRRIMPEKMSSSEAVHYAQGPARTYMPQYRLMAAEIAAAATGILVDIGTGPGNVPLEVGKRAPEARIIGIDVSEKMIEIAQKNKEAYSLANVSFKVMDARELAFGDNTLDMIISTDALHRRDAPVLEARRRSVDLRRFFRSHQPRYKDVYLRDQRHFSISLPGPVDPGAARVFAEGIRYDGQEVSRPDSV